MRGRHKGAPRFAALFALLLYTFLPTLHAIVHEASLVPAAAAGLAADAPGAPAPAPQDKPFHPTHEQGCALGQGLAGHGPALQPLLGATLLPAAADATLPLSPQPCPGGVSTSRPLNRGPPALDA